MKNWSGSHKSFHIPYLPSLQHHINLLLLRWISKKQKSKKKKVKSRKTYIMFLASISTAIIKTKTTRHAYHRNNRASLRSCTSRSLPAQSKLLHPTHRARASLPWLFFLGILPYYRLLSDDAHFLQIRLGWEIIAKEEVNPFFNAAPRPRSRFRS